MATLLNLKRRIKAAQNVSKTTRAMQMIAASKLRKAQEATLNSRPYIEKLTDISIRIADKTKEVFNHPYLKTDAQTGKKLLIVFSPDKGLCGPLVTNLVREVLKYNPKEYTFVVVGKKVEHYVISLNQEVIASFPFGTSLPAFEMVLPLVELIEEYYVFKKVDSVSVLSTNFVSIFSQKPNRSSLLPIEIPSDANDNTKNTDTLFEPVAAEIMPALLRKYLEMNLYQQLLESYLSEQAARMLSMQNATDNAKDIIEDLRLEYNKNRQAKITSEILDISGGKIHAR